MRCICAIYGARVRLRRRFCRKEYGHVPADRNHYPQSVIGALRLIIFAKFLAKAVDLDSGDRVFTGIETWGSIQYVDGDVIFLDLIGFARKIFFTHVPQEVCETR